MHVVATAGHVDHGKSTLVRALTGREPDRLAEERRRGLTIELGYAWTTLPGSAGRLGEPESAEVAFVDVPGHERFVATALAGLGPVPVALFVVAADDPWMPQAAEHLAALDALGVGRGVLVVTRADLTDPRPAGAAARAALAGTTLRDVPGLAVSARTGQGLDRLRATLSEVLAGVPLPDPAAPVRLWIDRRFTVRGTGTVVTGTLAAGTIRVGDALVGPGGARVRVRSIQSLETPRRSVTGTARVALALGGDTEELGRGDALVVAGSWTTTELVDVRLREADELPREPVLHIGSASTGTRARPLGPGFARVRLDRALPLRIGDRVLLRDPGRRRVWGADVVDPDPPELTRRGAGSRRADVLDSDDRAADGALAAQLRRRGVVGRDRLERLGASGALPGDAVAVGDLLVDGTRAAAARTTLGELVAAAGSAGLPTAEAAHRLDLPEEVVVALAAPPLSHRAGRLVVLAALPPVLAAKLDALRARLGDQPFAAPDAPWLIEHELSAADVAVLVRAGEVLRVADGVVLLAGSDDLALERLAGLAQPFTAAEARAAWSTSRRVAMPLLAHLDRTGRTVRLPDDRRRLRG